MRKRIWLCYKVGLALDPITDAPQCTNQMRRKNINEDNIEHQCDVETDCTVGPVCALENLCICRHDFPDGPNEKKSAYLPRSISYTYM